MKPWSIKKYIQYTGGLTVAILILQAVGYFIYKNIIPIAFSQSNIPAAAQNLDLTQAPITFVGKTSPTKPLNFIGKLYFSLRKINGAYDLGIYALNITDTVGSRFVTILADKIAKDKNYNVSISPAASLDSTKLVFAKAKANTQLFQIFTSDMSGGSVQQITNTLDKYKREPAFSSSGKLIAYVSYNSASSSAGYFDPNIPENWSTYVTDLKGNVVKITNGVNPVFSPNERKLLVLQNDGLHAFDINTLATPIPLGLVAKTEGGKASRSMQISVSTDGKMMAWTSGGAEGVVVFRITSWDEFSMSPFLTIKTKAYSSIFSPDGKYLAVLEWRRNNNDGNEYPVIMGYDLSNGTSGKIVTLASDDKSYLWLGAWK